MKPLIRVYHPYWLWEEIEYNMWGSVPDRDKYIDLMIRFTGDAVLYGAGMLRVVREWKYSCEHNLSNITQNRKAWVGHAACALLFRCPEDVVRAAWSRLSEEQQVQANAVADFAIREWEDAWQKSN